MRYADVSVIAYPKPSIAWKRRVASTVMAFASTAPRCTGTGGCSARHGSHGLVARARPGTVTKSRAARGAGLLPNGSRCWPDAHAARETATPMRRARAASRASRRWVEAHERARRIGGGSTGADTVRAPYGSLR